MTTSTLKANQPLSMPPLRQWIHATWEDYVVLRDASIEERTKLAFDRERLWIDMGGEGINHSGVCDLLTIMFGFWAVQHLEEVYSSLGRCLLEKPKTQACAPDLVLYIGADYPQWQEGELRRVDLTKWRVPNLVGEISDTTLAAIPNSKFDKGSPIPQDQRGCL